MGVEITIPEKKAIDLLEEIELHLAASAMPLRRARALAGGAGFIAGFIPWWKPFVAVIWAATAAALKPITGQANDGRKSASFAMIPTRRYRHALSWLQAFLQGWGRQSRCFHLQPLPPSDYQVIMDASP